MPLIPEGFDEDIENLKNEVAEDVRKIVFSWLQAAMIGTPVDTGFHRNNWQLDIGTLRPRVEGSSPQSTRTSALTNLPPLDGASNGRLKAAASFLGTWKIDSGDIFLHNSGPAIVHLDAGRSKQAPQGILDPATAAVRAKFGLG